MHCEFPLIKHIDDVLPAIQGCDEFYVAERDGYKVINYHVVMADTFPDVVLYDYEGVKCSEDSYAAIRRECRGIIFCSKTGNILRRPFHKFFNYGEKPETLSIGLLSNHTIYHKLDGSMIAPFILNNQIIWATKMSALDFHEKVKRFVGASAIDYERFCKELIAKEYTPIFEWTGPHNRIVLAYEKPELTLLAIRNIVTGEYIF